MDILIECQVLMTPILSLRRSRFAIPPSIGLLVTGSTGTGRTTLLHEVTRIMKCNAQTLTHIRWIDCKELLMKPLDEVFTVLASAFNESLHHPTTVIVLDDLDSICPRCKDSDRGSMRDVRSSMITIHLERLLKDYYAQQVRRFEIAHLSTRTNYSHHDHHNNDHVQKRQFQQHYQQQYNSSSSESNSGDDLDSTADLHFIMEQFLAYCSVENTLLVIGVSEAIDTIPPSLLQDFGLRKHFPIELLSPNHAYYLLKEVLSLSGLSIASPLSTASSSSSSSSSLLSSSSSSASVSTEEEDTIRDGLLGLRIYDVATLARRIRQSKVKEYLLNNN